MAPVIPLVWMFIASVSSAAVAIALGAPAPEVVCGMVGPFGAAAVSWLLVQKTYQASPEQVTSVMMKAFAGKMLFFAAYVVTMMRGLALSATPFMVSFTAFFIGVYVIEAVLLQRLFVGTR